MHTELRAVIRPEIVAGIANLPLGDLQRRLCLLILAAQAAHGHATEDHVAHLFSRPGERRRALDRLLLAGLIREDSHLPGQFFLKPQTIASASPPMQPPLFPGSALDPPLEPLPAPARVPPAHDDSLLACGDCVVTQRPTHVNGVHLLSEISHLPSETHVNVGATTGAPREILQALQAPQAAWPAEQIIEWLRSDSTFAGTPVRRRQRASWEKWGGWWEAVLRNNAQRIEQAWSEKFWPKRNQVRDPAGFMYARIQEKARGLG